MENVKKEVTYKKLIELFTGLNFIDITKRDKLSFFISDFKESLKPVLESYYKKLDKIERKWCSVDEDGNFFLDTNGNPLYTKFTKENIVKRDQEVEAVLLETVEIITTNCTDHSRINKLDISVLKLFNGILFSLSEQEIINLYAEKETVPMQKEPVN